MKNLYDRVGELVTTERLIGAGEVMLGTFLIGLVSLPETKDAAIFGYTLGGFAVVDGMADIISNRPARLFELAYNGLNYLFNRRKKKNKLEEEDEQ